MTTATGHVKDLVPDAIGVNLTVRVLSKVMEVEHRLESGELIRFADFLVGDATGCVTLLAKNDQIDACAVGSLVSITSAAAYLFDKHLRVRVGRWGTVAPLPDDASLIPNLANNLSSTPLIPAGFES